MTVHRYVGSKYDVQCAKMGLRYYMNFSKESQLATDLYAFLNNNPELLGMMLTVFKVVGA